MYLYCCGTGACDSQKDDRHLLGMKQLQGVNVGTKAQTNLSGSAKMHLIR